MNIYQPILLFDGVCNLCDTTVNFIIDRDPNKNIKFAALQSKSGQELLSHFSLSTENFDTVILVYKGKVHKKTGAILRVVHWMKFPWPFLLIFIIIPFFLRDFMYSIIAKNRYKWFGKMDYCRVPSADLKERFLE